MKFRPAQTFWEAYATLPGDIKEQARVAFRRFQVRKMQGHPGIWEGHINLQYVFTFHMEQESETGEVVYVFRNIGTHDIYRRP